MTLTTEQIEHYETHGWFAPIDVMSPTEANDLLQELERAEEHSPDQLHAEHRNNAHLSFDFLASVVVDDRIVDPVASLIGPDISLWSTVLFVKEPDSDAWVSWHQDGHYMGLGGENFVTAWLALTPSTVESGCVSVAPGSHRTRLDHVDTYGVSNILTRGQRVESPDPDDVVHLELEPGQMSLHHPWLVHGSQPNRSRNRRIGLAMQSYLGAGVSVQRGEHHVVSVRGEPNPDFTYVPLPGSDPTTNRHVRDEANRALASVLYDGAEQTRRL